MSRSQMCHIKKFIHHEDFELHFTDTVDPLRLIPCLRIRESHKEEVKKASDRRTDRANMDLLSWVKREPNWEEMLYRALEKTGYLKPIWEKVYPDREVKSSSERREVTLSTPLQDLPSLHENLLGLDIHERWRKLAEYAGMTFQEVEQIEARAQARQKPCSEVLIRFLIEKKGNGATLQWLLEGLKHCEQRNVFDNVCRQLDMESLMEEDEVDGSRNPSHQAGHLGRSKTRDPVSALWERLQGSPVVAPSDQFVQAMEEQGCDETPGFDEVDKSSSTPAPVEAAPSCSGPTGTPVPPESETQQEEKAGQFYELMPGVAGQAPLGTVLIPPREDARQRGADLPAPNPDSNARDPPANSMHGKDYEATTGMENGPCPNRDMVNADERQASGEDNFYAINTADEGNHGEDEDSGHDDMKPYEVMLREDGTQLARDEQDGRPASNCQPTESCPLNLEQAVVDVVSELNRKLADQTFSQSSGSTEGSHEEEQVDSFSSTPSIDLQNRQRLPQTVSPSLFTPSADSHAGDLGQAGAAQALSVNCQNLPNLSLSRLGASGELEPLRCQPPQPHVASCLDGSRLPGDASPASGDAVATGAETSLPDNSSVREMHGENDLASPASSPIPALLLRSSADAVGMLAGNGPRPSPSSSKNAPFSSNGATAGGMLLRSSAPPPPSSSSSSGSAPLFTDRANTSEMLMRNGPHPSPSSSSNPASSPSGSLQHTERSEDLSHPASCKSPSLGRSNAAVGLPGDSLSPSLYPPPPSASAVNVQAMLEEHQLSEDGTGRVLAGDDADAGMMRKSPGNAHDASSRGDAYSVHEVLGAGFQAAGRQDVLLDEDSMAPSDAQAFGERSASNEGENLREESLLHSLFDFFLNLE